MRWIYFLFFLYMMMYLHISMLHGKVKALNYKMDTLIELFTEPVDDKTPEVPPESHTDKTAI